MGNVIFIYIYTIDKKDQNLVVNNEINIREQIEVCMV